MAGLRTVLADVTWLARFGAYEHTDRIIYDVEAYGGNLRAEERGSTDLVDWAGPAELDSWPLMPFTSRLLGRPVPAPEVASSDGAPDSGTDIPDGAPKRVQRFGAYAVATDPAGRILLTRIATNFPGAGLWHLPGGGTDHGETPEEALARELVEETAQVGRITGLLGISHRYDPAAMGPEGVPMSWHVVRVLFRVQVETPTEPVVTEAAGGSTDAAGWFSPEQAEKLPLTEIARSALRRLVTEQTRQ